VYKILPLVPILSQINPVHILPLSFYLISLHALPFTPNQYDKAPPTTIKRMAAAICYLYQPHPHKTHYFFHLVILLGLPDPEDKDTTILPNTRN
jgi:hypothetical protein